MPRSGGSPARTKVSARVSAAEDFVLTPGDEPFDLAFALRVGAFDGRHPELFDRAAARVAAAMRPGVALDVDGGGPLRRVEFAS